MARRRYVSIRTFVLALLVGELALAVGLTWALWYSNGASTVAAVQEQALRERALRVGERIAEFLAVPEQVNQVIADGIALGTVDLVSLEANEALMARLLRSFPSVSYVGIGLERGDFIGIERPAPESSSQIRYKLDLLNDGTRRQRNTWTVALEGRGAPQVRSDYVVTERPWYRAASEHRAPGWSPIYTYFREPPRLAITASRPILDGGGRLVGVYGTDLVLSAVDDFLRRLRASGSGHAMLVERDGRLVASSSLRSSARVQAGKAERVFAAEFGDPVISGVARALVKRFGGFQALGEQQLALEIDDETLLVRTLPIAEPASLGWIAVVVVPRVDLVGDAAARTRTTGLVFLALLVMVTLAALATTWRVSEPFMVLARKIRSIRHLRLDNDFGVSSDIREVRVLSEELGRMQAGLLSFSRFVPANLVRQVMAAGGVARLGGEERVITVLFSDLAGYSTVIEHLPPARVVEMLGEYLEAMQEIVETHGGSVLEIIGDGMLVVFGAPAELDGHPAAAVRCALDMRARLAELNQTWDQTGLSALWRAHGFQSLQFRIGLHTGPVVAGNLGSKVHMKYGVVGDTVNVAARLEAANKALGTDILMSEQVAAALPPDLAALCIDRGEVTLKGRAQRQRVFGMAAVYSGDSQMKLL